MAGVTPIAGLKPVRNSRRSAEIGKSLDAIRDDAGVKPPNAPYYRRDLPLSAGSHGWQTRTVDVVGGGLLDPEALDDWCRQELRSPPVDRLFETVHLSVVVGLHLADGQEVVVKVRRMSHRVDACFDIQRHLFGTGFPCPEPLAGPSALGAGVATAERYLPSASRGIARPTAARCAVLLADLIAKAPPAGRFASLEPGPAWVDWDADRRVTWPSPDDLDVA